jgi:cytochrome bd-type quinol oxidase subunit 1
MPPIDERDRPEEANSDAAQVPGADFPRYVRLLAVVYVLSRIIGPLGFLILSLVAGFLWYQRDLSLDGLVLGLWLAALACPLLCAAFRWWFTRWGRRHWSDASGK